MLKDLVFEQLKQAMKDKDSVSKGVLQVLKSALDQAEKEKGAALTKQEEIEIVNRELKQSNQALDGAKAANRKDLIANEEAKIKLLKSFLPEQLSENAIVEKLMEAGIDGKVSMGEAMKIAKSLLNGQADGGTLSKVVKQLISKK